MDDAWSLLNWEWDYQEEAHGSSELNHPMLYSTMELETKIVYAQEKIARIEDEVLHFKCLLKKTIKERDEFQFKCQSLVSKNLILRQEIQNFEPNASFIAIDTLTSYTEDDPIVRVVSSSSFDENYDRIQEIDQISLKSLLQSPSQGHMNIDNMVITKRLPKNGKFLQAMMEAGPLLQTCLLVGPLPQWRNPPPQLNLTKILPTTIPLSPTTNPWMNLHQDSHVSAITDDGGKFISRKRSLEHSNEVHDYDFLSTTKT